VVGGTPVVKRSCHTLSVHWRGSSRDRGGDQELSTKKS
jgi:hypothetical protein